MERKKVIEYVIILLIIIAVVLLLWFLLRKESPEGFGPSPYNPQVVRDMPQAVDTFTPDRLAQGRQGPEVAARVFAERFGSYSNQSGYGNVSDVLELVTPELRAELTSLRTAVAGEITESFYGVNTHVVSISMPQTTSAGTILELQTQREEEVGSPGNVRVRYQKLTLTLVENGNSWLVSDYAWEE